MPGSTFGKLFQLHTFGESHGSAIGGIIDGCPAGLEIDFEFIQHELNRRKTNQGLWSSPRVEPDEVKFLSGIFENKTLGTPIAFIVENKNQRSEDYEHLKYVFRPSHADYTYYAKYGIRDYRGGGRSSARETIARVVGGAIAKLLLKTLDIQILAFVSKIKHIHIPYVLDKISSDAIEQNPFRCPSDEKNDEIRYLVEQAKNDGDTIGGIITCVIRNVPAGWGEPVFDKLNALLAHAMMSINAVKGFEIGDGFAISEKFGSEVNDEMFLENNQVKFKSNHSGGIQGGISNGNDIIFNVAFKPIASIKKEQSTVNLESENIKIKIEGRHDVMVLPRAVPIVESMTALVLADVYLMSKINRL
ncbi:MAG: chorismate synthase [Bacteroidia bacterium]|nr:MAG: chorismate synthase [Bacteroidia bacterium]